MVINPGEFRVFFPSDPDDSCISKKDSLYLYSPSTHNPQDIPNWRAFQDALKDWPLDVKPILPKNFPVERKFKVGDDDAPPKWEPQAGQWVRVIDPAVFNRAIKTDWIGVWEKHAEWSDVFFPGLGGQSCYKPHDKLVPIPNLAAYLLEHGTAIPNYRAVIEYLAERKKL